MAITATVELTLGELLALWRRQAGYTQTEAAEALSRMLHLDISRGKLVRWELGRGDEPDMLVIGGVLTLYDRRIGELPEPVRAVYTDVYSILKSRCLSKRGSSAA